MPSGETSSATGFNPIVSGISPATVTGRFAAGLLMLSGIGLFSTLAAAVAAYFVGEDEGRELQGIQDRLDRIEVALRELNERQQSEDRSD